MDLQNYASKLQIYLKETNVLETTTLLPELNLLAQDFFDSVRSSDFQTANELSQLVYDVCFAVYNLDHWVRKLTAATVIADLLNASPEIFGQYTEALVNNARTLLSHKKREVRDSSARMLAQLPEQQFDKVLKNVAPADGDAAEFREALSVMCGYKLSKQHNDVCVKYLFDNLTFVGKSLIETNYVHWYTQRSFIKAMLNKEEGNQIASNEELYDKMKLSFNVDEMKVRKSAADAAAIFYASSEEHLYKLFEELQKIIDENLNSQKANYYIQTVLMAASVYIQIMMGKHVSYTVSKYVISQDNSLTLQTLLIKIYKEINDEFIDQKTLSGMYKGAIIIALIPESVIIKGSLNTSYVKQIEGALDAIIFMQKSFKQSIQEYKLELLLLNQFHNQSIAVNALRCLQYYNVIENGEEYSRNCYDFNDLNAQDIVNFAILKMIDDSSEIRHCACQLLIRYFNDIINKHGNLIQSNLVMQSHLTAVSMAIVSMFDQKYSRQQGNAMTLKTTAELMSLIAPYLSYTEIDALILVSQQQFLERDDYCGQLGKFYTLTGHEKYAQMCLIYAFDAINIQLSDYCKTFVGVAAKLFREDLFIQTVKEHFLADDSENLYLNGVSRLFFALKTYNNVKISQQLLDLLDEILEKATDFFDEVIDIFKVYQKAINSDDAEITVEGSEELTITGQEEFDPDPEKTIGMIQSQLHDNPTPTTIKEIILSTSGWQSEFAQKTYEQVILDTRVKVELKQLLAAAMLQSDKIFNYEIEIDVRRNEVFDFNKING